MFRFFKILMFLIGIYNSGLSQSKLRYIEIHNLLTDSSKEYVKHINSILHAKTSRPKDDSLFLDNVIRYFLTDSSDLQFISNKNLLPQIKMVSVNDNNIKFKDKIGRNKYEIEICKSLVDTQKYYIKINKPETYPIEGTINNQDIFGKYEERVNENYHISKIRIKVNNTELKIPNDELINLFSPNFGKPHIWDKTKNQLVKIYAYTSLDNRYLYLYIWGGFEGFEIYYAKLIFDKEKYIKKIVIDYMTISSSCGFRSDFIGF